MADKPTASSRNPRILRRAAFCLLCGLLACLFPRHSAAAQTDAYAIIEQVNLLRAAYGLEPHTVDAGLMAYAQAHSEYQAANGISTHIHADGMVPQDIGLVENVAGGQIGYITAEDVVFSVWNDPVHMKVMVGHATGSIGAGVANDGTDEYITIDVRPGGQSSTSGTAQPGAQLTGQATIPVVRLVTCTPQADGSVIHLVGYGQTLWAIADAYHISLDQLRAWNGYAADDSGIYAGQRLLVLPLSQVTVSPTVTVTPTVETVSATPSTAITASVTTAVCCPPEGSDQSGVSPQAMNDRSVIWLLGAGGLILAGLILLVFVLFRSRS